MSMGVCIVINKLAYYPAKYLLIQFSLLKGELIATPIYIQILIEIIPGGYIYFVDKISFDKIIS